jgi:ApaG protein
LITPAASPSLARLAKPANMGLMRFPGRHTEGRRAATSGTATVVETADGGLMYRTTTRKIMVAVEPVYLPGESSHENGYYMWAYKVHIENHGPEVVQLISRHWRITDSQGHVIEVSGKGVVGMQPVLQPGEIYEYTSGTPLGTPFGIMGGEYQMTTASGERFEIEIPTFSLHSPFARTVLN